MTARCCLSIHPENVRKSEVFLMFSGGIDKQHRAVWVKLDIWIAIKISGNFNAASLITTAEIIFC